MKFLRIIDTDEVRYYINPKYVVYLKETTPTNVPTVEIMTRHYIIRTEMSLEDLYDKFRWIEIEAMDEFFDINSEEGG